MPGPGCHLRRAPRFPSFSFGMTIDLRNKRFFRPAAVCSGVAFGLLALLAGCDRGAGANEVTRHGIAFPGDAEIAKALAADFALDANNAKARELIQRLGGAEGRIDYTVHQVIYRQGAFETRYDVRLKMSQSGADSLQKLYAAMIPADEAAKLPAQTLAAYDQWLADSVRALEKTEPAQAATLRATLDKLGKCFREVRPGDDVPLMVGLVALVSPTRDGWHAEKLPAPQLQLQCLPI